MLLFSCFISEDNKAQRGESLTLGHTAQGGHIRTEDSNPQVLLCSELPLDKSKLSRSRHWDLEAEASYLTLGPGTPETGRWRFHKPKQESLEKNQAQLSSRGPPPGVLKKAAEGGNRWGPWTRKLMFVKWSKTEVLPLARQETMPIFLPTLIWREQANGGIGCSKNRNEWTAKQACKS